MGAVARGETLLVMSAHRAPTSRQNIRADHPMRRWVCGQPVHRGLGPIAVRMEYLGERGARPPCRDDLTGHRELSATRERSDDPTG